MRFIRGLLKNFLFFACLLSLIGSALGKQEIETILPAGSVNDVPPNQSFPMGLITPAQRILPALHEGEGEQLNKEGTPLWPIMNPGQRGILKANPATLLVEPSDREVINPTPVKPVLLKSPWTYDYSAGFNQRNNEVDRLFQAGEMTEGRYAWEKYELTREWRQIYGTAVPKAVVRGQP